MCESIAEEIQVKLLQKARLYQVDGSPGPLSDQRGWRVIAQHLREIAGEIKEE